MWTPDDEPRTLDQALAMRVRAARARGAYTIATVAGLARVDPSVVVTLENGGAVADAAACDRVLAVLGLRPEGPRHSALALDFTHSVMKARSEPSSIWLRIRLADRRISPRRRRSRPDR